MRKICVVVTARPSYSRIKTALQAMQVHPEIELQLVVAASALLARYGTAINYIERDGFHIDARVFNVLEGENLTAMAKTTGLGILELASVFERLQPDAVMTIADRFETMSTAISASYMNLPLIHIQGGEVTGNIDEKVRHAITKLADVHLVASEGAAKRVIRMGEDPHTVFNTGCPSIDLAEEVRKAPEMNFDPFERYGGVGGYPDLEAGYLVLMQHPVTTEYEQSRAHIIETLKALAHLDMPVCVFWPNVDAGSDGTSNGIRSFRENSKKSNFHFFKNMEPSDFLRFLYHSKCLVGNSSVGIRECAYLGVPVVNIGSRQNGRERGKNVIDVGYHHEEISDAIRKHLRSSRPERDQLYGDGQAGNNIAEVVSQVSLKIDKRICY